MKSLLQMKNACNIEEKKPEIKQFCSIRKFLFIGYSTSTFEEQNFFFVFNSIWGQLGLGELKHCFLIHPFKSYQQFSSLIFF